MSAPSSPFYAPSLDRSQCHEFGNVSVSTSFTPPPPPPARFAYTSSNVSRRTISPPKALSLVEHSLSSDMEKRLAAVEHSLRTIELPRGLESRLTALEESLELLTVDVADTQARLETPKQETRSGTTSEGVLRLGRPVFDGQTELGAIRGSAEAHDMADHNRRLNTLEDLVAQVRDRLKDASKEGLKSEIDAQLYHQINRLNDMMDAKVGDLQKRLTCFEKDHAHTRGLEARLESYKHSLQQHEHDRRQMLDQQQLLLKQYQDDLDNAQHSADQDCMFKKVAEISQTVDTLRVSMVADERRIQLLESRVEDNERVRLNALAADQSEEILTMKTKHDKLVQSVEWLTADADDRSQQTRALMDEMARICTDLQGVEGAHTTLTTAMRKELKDDVMNILLKAADQAEEIAVIKTDHEQLMQSVEQQSSQKAWGLEDEVTRMIEAKQKAATVEAQNDDIKKIRNDLQNLQNERLAQSQQATQIRTDLQILQNQLNQHAAVSLEAAAQSAQIEAVEKSVAGLSQQAEASRAEIRVAVESMRKEHASLNIVTKATMQDLADKHAKELEAVSSKFEDFQKAVSSCTTFEDTLAQRLTSIESAQKVVPDERALKLMLMQMVQEQASNLHTTYNAQAIMQDFADKHSKDLEAVSGKFGDFQSAVSSCKAFEDTLAQRLLSLENAHSEEKAAVKLMLMQMVQEEVAKLHTMYHTQATMQDLALKHSRELEAVGGKFGDLQSAVSSCRTAEEMFAQRLTSIENAQKMAPDERTMKLMLLQTVQEEVAKLHTTYNAQAKALMQELADRHAKEAVASEKIADIQRSVSACTTFEDTLAQRLTSIENAQKVAPDERTVKLMLTQTVQEEVAKLHTPDHAQAHSDDVKLMLMQLVQEEMAKLHTKYDAQAVEVVEIRIALQSLRDAHASRMKGEEKHAPHEGLVKELKSILMQTVLEEVFHLRTQLETQATNQSAQIMQSKSDCEALVTRQEHELMEIRANLKSLQAHSFLMKECSQSPRQKAENYPELHQTCKDMLNALNHMEKGHEVLRKDIDLFRLDGDEKIELVTKKIKFQTESVQDVVAKQNTFVEVVDDFKKQVSETTRVQCQYVRDVVEKQKTLIEDIADFKMQATKSEKMQHRYDELARSLGEVRATLSNVTDDRYVATSIRTLSTDVSDINDKLQKQKNEYETFEKSMKALLQSWLDNIGHKLQVGSLSPRLNQGNAEHSVEPDAVARLRAEAHIQAADQNMKIEKVQRGYEELARSLEQAQATLKTVPDDRYGEAASIRTLTNDVSQIRHTLQKQQVDYESLEKSMKVADQNMKIEKMQHGYEELARSLKQTQATLNKVIGGRSAEGASIRTLMDDVAKMNCTLQNQKIEYESLGKSTKGNCEPTVPLDYLTKVAQDEVARLRTEIVIQAADQNRQIAKVQKEYEGLAGSLEQAFAALNEVTDHRYREAAGIKTHMNDVSEIREDLQKLRHEHISLEKSIKDPMGALLQDVVQLRGALLTVERLSPENGSHRCDDLAELRKEHSNFVALIIQRHSETERKLACVESDLATLRLEVRTRVDVVTPAMMELADRQGSSEVTSHGAKSPDMVSARLDFMGYGQRIQKQLDNMHDEIDRRFSALCSETSLMHRLEAVERAQEKSKRQLVSMEGCIRPLALDIPELTRTMKQYEQRVGHEVSNAVKPVEDIMSKLAIGVMKTLQLLGITSADVCERIGTWQDVCADLPRLLDHAWLRLRLKKGATVLKLLRQKADVEHVRELQTKLDILLGHSSQPPITPWTDSPRRVPVPPSRVNHEDADCRKPRRPSSAGRRWAYSAPPGESDEYDEPC